MNETGECTLRFQDSKFTRGTFYATCAPPPGAPPGGEFHYASYCGPVSLCFILFMPWTCCCLFYDGAGGFDKITVYIAPDGTMYKHPEGHIIRPADLCIFTVNPSPFDPTAPDVYG